MSSTCTIVIPTHNRPHYLDRCVRWFLPLGYPIIIADSSTDRWQSDFLTNPAITYLSCPGGVEVYLEKLKVALAQVKTPLVAMCADDDFMTAEGLTESVQFLNAHPDYSFSQGYTYFFQPFGTRVVVWPMFFGTHQIDIESWIDRVERAADTVYYGVNRTDVLRTAIDFLIHQDFAEILDAAAGFFDLCLLTYVAKRGKFRRVPIPFALREYSPIIGTAGTRPATIVSRNVPDFYKNLLTFLMDGDKSEAIRTRLLRRFSGEYAGEILFDLADSRSKKRFLSRLPVRLVHHAEFFYRLFGAARAYWSFACFPFLKIFLRPEYRRFRRVLLSAEGQ